MGLDSSKGNQLKLVNRRSPLLWGVPLPSVALCIVVIVIACVVDGDREDAMRKNNGKNILDSVLFSAAAEDIVSMQKLL